MQSPQRGNAPAHSRVYYSELCAFRSPGSLAGNRLGLITRWGGARSPVTATRDETLEQTRRHWLRPPSAMV